MNDGILFSKDMKAIIAYPPARPGSTYTVPDGVTTINYSAFDDANNLLSVYIPAGVTSIGEEAFIFCHNLISINVDPSNPNYVTVDGVLFNHNQSILYDYPGDKEGPYVIPDTVTAIYNTAFWETNGLTSITIPASVQKFIPDNSTCNPFGGSNLKEIIVDPNSPLLACQGDVLFNPDITTLISYPAARNPDELTVTSASNNIKLTQSGRVGNYTVPDTVNTIVSRAFKGTNLVSVTIPKNVTNIDGDAFFMANGVKIRGYKGSYAETYAQNHGIQFIDITPAPNPPDIPVTGTYRANKIPAKVKANTTIQINPTPAPGKYTLQSVTYSSSNTSISTVDANGKITFLSGGKVKITIIETFLTVDKNGKTKLKVTRITKTITVGQLVSSITFSQPGYTIAKTQTMKLTPKIDPNSASNKKVRWTSSNAKVAKVSSAGVVTGKGAGTATIICAAQDGSRVSAICTVTVIPIYPMGVKLSKANLQIKPGKTGTLKATVLPSNTDFKTITWTSSDPSIATVDGKGKIIGVSTGTVTITATTSNGLTAACTATIK